jgi:hypothetical protein
MLLDEEAMTLIKIHLTDQELAFVNERASRELSDPGTWIRRTAVSVADGRAKVSVNPDHSEFTRWPRP